MPLEKLGKIDPYKYDVLVIIDALRAWQLFNTSTRSFIQNLKDPGDRKKIVLFLTAGKPEKNYKFMNVDCITAASQVNKDAEIIEEISVKINGMLR